VTLTVSETLGTMVAWYAMMLTIGMLQTLLSELVHTDFSRGVVVTMTNLLSTWITIGMARQRLNDSIRLTRRSVGFGILGGILSLLGVVALTHSDLVTGHFTWARSLTVHLFAPLREEIIFRAFMMRNITARFGLTWGVILNSVLFERMHIAAVGSNIIENDFSPERFFAGLVFSLMYIASSWNVLTPILGHTICNLGITLQNNNF